MFSIRPLPEFTAWLDGLSDPSVRGIVVARIKRLALGLMGDVAPVGEGFRSCGFTRVRVGACMSRSGAIG
jgi:putative component of toxin-antitoxin plasmid stabilization module